VRINLVQGIHYAIWGYYPELKIDILRGSAAGLGVGILGAGAIGRDYRFVALGLVIYGAARFLPRLHGYKERWRFKD